MKIYNHKNMKTNIYKYVYIHIYMQKNTNVKNIKESVKRVNICIWKIIKQDPIETLTNKQTNKEKINKNSKYRNKKIYKCISNVRGKMFT